MFRGSTAEITLVQSRGCHLCADARAAIEDLSARFAIVLTTIDARSAEGVALVVRHRPALQPLVLLDGEMFSAGRLPRRKLERQLSERTQMAAS